jgi:hypothetical protein
MGQESDFWLVGAIRGWFDATGYQGGYHVVHSGPIQGFSTRVVMLELVVLEVFLHPLLIQHLL